MFRRRKKTAVVGLGRPRKSPTADVTDVVKKFLNLRDQADLFVKCSGMHTLEWLLPGIEDGSVDEILLQGIIEVSNCRFRYDN